MTIATDIQRLYVAFFNRPADSAGLSYWVDQAAKNGGVEFVANAFSASPEYQPYLSTFSGMANAEAVNAIYMNLFGRPAEASGVTYWTNALDNGLPLSKLALTISQGAQKGDAVAVANKVAAASAFTAATATSAGKVYGYSGDAANTVAKTWLSGVTDDASLAAKLGTVDANGTAIGDAVGVATARLRRSNARSKAVILLTDGDSNSGTVMPDTAAHLAQTQAVRVYTVQIGNGDDVDVPEGTGDRGVDGEHRTDDDERDLRVLTEAEVEDQQRHPGERRHRARRADRRRQEGVREP